MTIEEAIEVLDKMKYSQKVNKNGFVISNVDIENEALDMAIQALSQEPCRYWQNGKCNGNTEVCDDAISRDMALEKMADYVASGYADSAKDFEEYSRIICQLPSVTQKSVLDKIRAEIIKHFEGCYLEEDMTDERKAEHKAYENVLQIIDKYIK